MKLSDIVGHWDLTVYPQAALVIFLVVFVAVVIKVYMSPGAKGLQKYSTMAIDDETAASSSRTTTQTQG